MLTFLVSRLLKLYDPWEHLGYKPRPGEIEAALPWEDHEDDYLDRTRQYHAGRIKFFLNQLANRKALDPISVDNVCNGGTSTRSPSCWMDTTGCALRPWPGVDASP